MPLSHELDALGDEIRQVLPPQERLLAVTSVGIAFGSTGRHDPDFRQSKMGRMLTDKARGMSAAIDRASDKVKVPRWVAKGATLAGGIDGIGPSWVGPGKLLRRWFGGQVVDGHPGSVARALQAELSPYGHGSYLAVTDRRLLVLKAASLLSNRVVSDDPPEWAAPRELVARARHAPRALGRARFELGFADGSRIVLSGYPPHLGGWHARQIASALSG